MQKYIRCHIVEAEPMTRGDYNKHRGWEIPANENPADEGYHVVYPDGYESWCPKAQFEKQGFPLEDGSKITEKDISDFKLLGYQAVSTMSAPDGKPYTLTEMVYPTGFTDFATSACVDPKNYSEEIGGDICIKKINDHLWNCLGFMLQWAKDGLSDIGMEIAKKVDAEEAKRNTIRIEAGVRYPEDGEINDTAEDNDNPKMPFLVPDPDSKGEWRWNLDVNIATGEVVNWPKEVVAHVHYKVCDCCRIKYGDKSYEEYVPDFLSIDGQGYGDYVILTIENGFIKNWNAGSCRRFINEELSGN